MRGRPRRIFGAKRSGRSRRRVAAGALLVAVAVWVAMHFHATPTVPTCDSTPVKREVTQSLARMLSAAPRDVMPSRLHMEGRSESGPAAGSVRHCAAEVTLGNRDDRVVQFNVVPSEDAEKGYRVQVADIGADAERP